MHSNDFKDSQYENDKLSVSKTGSKLTYKKSYDSYLFPFKFRIWQSINWTNYENDK